MQELEKSAVYRLWSHVTTDIIGTPGWENSFTPMTTMAEVKAETTTEDSYRYFMLLDENRVPVGYTLY